ncbi:MAG: electron transport complex subunit RsxC [Spirochaetales bacterium]|nr:electron transport complex subunit RsxC [Spirochaetales bacterium]
MTSTPSSLDAARGFRSSFRHGVHLPDSKHYTAHRPIERFPFPPRLYLILSQHTGKPSVPIVHRGQEVVRGEPIARADGFVSVPLHAPATGVVERIDRVPTAKGPYREAIVLKVYPGETQQVLYGSPRDVEAMRPEEIVQGVQEAGLVGLGGAAFPTHVKLSPPPGHAVDTLLINGCECEPFLTTDHRIMIEQADEVIRGARLLMRALGAERAIIATEDNKLDAAQALQQGLQRALQQGLQRAFPKDGAITVELTKTKYPQGAEKMLAKALVNREIPSGQYPSSVGLGVFNVGTTAQIGTLLPHRRGVIERVVTVTGPGVEKPGNYLVAIGTPLGFILERLGCRGPARYLIAGGPMMGETVPSLDVPITKGCGGLLVLRSEDYPREELSEPFPCINCGKCLEACPMLLNPSAMGKLAAKRLYSEMEAYHLSDCFECGACSYVCPARIPLVQYFRMAKLMNRRARAGSQ